MSCFVKSDTIPDWYVHYDLLHKTGISVPVVRTIVAIVTFIMLEFGDRVS